MIPQSGILAKLFEFQPPPLDPRPHSWGQGKGGKTGDRLGKSASAPPVFPKNIFKVLSERTTKIVIGLGEEFFDSPQILLQSSLLNNFLMSKANSVL